MRRTKKNLDIRSGFVVYTDNRKPLRIRLKNENMEVVKRVAKYYETSMNSVIEQLLEQVLKETGWLPHD